MKKVLLIISIIVVVGMVVLTMTKPERSEHFYLVKKTVAKVVDRELNANPLTAVFATLGTMSTLNVVDDYLSKNLMMQDHTFYTTGVLRYNDMFIPISIGVFGQVYLTVSEDDIKKTLKMPEIKDMVHSENVEDAIKKYMKKNNN